MIPKNNKIFIGLFLFININSFIFSMEQPKDYYKVLGISKTATPDEIKKAYYKLSLQYHPDRNPSPEAKEQWIKILEAYEILSDPAKRTLYDAGKSKTGTEQFNESSQTTAEKFIDEMKEPVQKLDSALLNNNVQMAKKAQAVKDVALEACTYVNSKPNPIFSEAVAADMKIGIAFLDLLIQLAYLTSDLTTSFEMLSSINTLNSRIDKCKIVENNLYNKFKSDIDFIESVETISGLVMDPDLVNTARSIKNYYNQFMKMYNGIKAAVADRSRFKEVLRPLYNEAHARTPVDVYDPLQENIENLVATLQQIKIY